MRKEEKMKKTLLIGTSLWVIILLAAPLGAKAAPASAADFFKDNKVTLICGYGPGGASDIASRLLASYWTEVTGGAMVVKNMEGAGGLVGANFVYEAKPDGLTMGQSNFGSVFLGGVLMGQAGVKFDVAKLNFIGAMFTPPWGFSIGAKTPGTTIGDLQKAKGLKFAGPSPKDNAVTNAALLIDFFGLDAKIVTGYKGSAEMGLACGRGEADGSVIPGSGLIVQMEKGFMKSPPLVVFHRERTEYFPNTPTLLDLVKASTKKDLTPEQEKLFTVVELLNRADMVFYAPPGIPEDRLKFMRDAFVRVTANSALQEISKKWWPVWTKPLTSDDLTVIIKKTLATPKEDVARINQLVNKYLAIK